ncbi:hypothetical protein [Massilia glaciei]|uniref:DUF3325 domain-containing protein n=1 Tax=Massilia glaciei TaxID=1524097 RepID=A0A2U2HHP0_9BURK|nr:hypothetical protein [Massilia glaciei]PWF45440.1 hypothetical protein C7C56_017685 [Massilia glaciei]
MLYAAACIITLLALAHSWLGERHILIRLFRRGILPKVLGTEEFTKGTLRFVWHFTSLIALGFAALLVQIAGGVPAPALAPTIGWTLIVAGILPLVFTRGRHLSWIFLFAAGALCLFD